MFGLSMYGCSVNGIDSYAEAAAFFESCPTSRGMRDGVHRAIKGKEGSRNMGVRMAGDVVCFRYHFTDVVVWRPDGSYSVDLTYDSLSTCEFANRFVPAGHYATKSGHLYAVGDTIYPARCRLHISADGEVSGMRHRFQKTVVDREKAKHTLAETNYEAYRKWYTAMWPMVKDNMLPKRVRSFPKAEIEYCLQDEELWHELMMSCFGDPATIRDHFYCKGGAYKQEFADTLSSKGGNDKWALS